MPTTYLLLGTNIGDRRLHLKTAIELIAKEVRTIIVQSNVYETAPWGKTDQAPFLNQAIAIDTLLPPLVLLHRLKTIETQMGRAESTKWAARLIDIDILLYGNEIILETTLQIPHPYLPMRRFALQPLAEIAGGIVHPVVLKTINELISECPDGSQVSKITTV